MDTAELNDRLIAIGDAVKRKGWLSASINIYVHLGIFDREIGRLDPMIFYHPSITASTRDEYGAPTSHEFVRGGIQSTNALDQAIAKLQEAVDAMPTMATVIDRIEEAKAKLSTDERRLLGVR